ncbi:hypothetical protein OAA09_00525 [bacterium]|nr:hypothetical protein [bacterium]
MEVTLDYKVGQVLYALSSKEMSVIPLRITERIVRETMTGEVVSYVATTTDGKVVNDLSKLTARFFTSSGDTKAAMVKNATDVIQSIVERAESKASEHFKSMPNTKDDSPEQSDKSQAKKIKLDDAPQSVTLPDGTVAKVNLPKEMMR